MVRLRRIEKREGNIKSREEQWRRVILDYITSQNPTTQQGKKRRKATPPARWSLYFKWKKNLNTQNCPDKAARSMHMMGGHYTAERNNSVGLVRHEDNRIKFTTESMKKGFHCSVNLRIYYVTQVFSTIFCVITELHMEIYSIAHL